MTRRQYVIGLVALAVTFVVFVVPFLFVFLTAVKSRSEAARMDFSWPTEWHLIENLVEVIQARDYMLLLAYFNSTVITVGAVALLVIFGAMIGYVLQRRPTGWNKLIYAFVLAGLMIPAGGGADDLGAAEHRPLQDDARHDPDPGRLWARLHRAAVSKLRGVDPARSR